MKLFWIIILIISAGIQSANSAYFPKDSFNFSHENAINRIQPRIPENSRVQVLKALTKTNRDQILMKLVPYQLVGEENWFDLRGIEVNKGELTGKANLSRICWDYARFNQVDLSGAELNSTLMRGVLFNNVNFTNAQIDSAHLESSDFLDCKLYNANFRMSNFNLKSSFRNCVLDNTRFDNCKKMVGVIFCNSSIKNAAFTNTNLRGSQFIDDDLTGSSFAFSNLTNVDFCGSKLKTVDFTETILADAMLQSATIIGPLRLIRTYLSGAYLGDLDISIIDISYVNWQDHNYYIGEELKADKINIHDGSIGSLLEKQTLYSQAELIYRILAEKYRRTGQMDDYLKLRFRSLETRRKLLSFQKNKLLTPEYLWLTISKYVDGYGTMVGRLVLTLLNTIVMFGLIYFIGWTLCQRDWAKWYKTQPDGRGFFIYDNGIILGLSDAPKDRFKDSKGWRKLLILMQLLLTAIWFSIESIFMFAENVMRIPDILNLLRIKEEKLVAVGGARVLVGIEAFLGVVLFFFAARMLLLVMGLYQ